MANWYYVGENTYLFYSNVVGSDQMILNSAVFSDLRKLEDLNLLVVLALI